MKARKKVITSFQFDQALREEIARARGKNVSVNTICSAAMFAALLGRRLFGDHRRQSDDYLADVRLLIADAQAERMECARAQQEEKRQSSRIIIPGNHN